MRCPRSYLSAVLLKYQMVPVRYADKRVTKRPRRSLGNLIVRKLRVESRILCPADVEDALSYVSALVWMGIEGLHDDLPTYSLESSYPTVCRSISLPCHPVLVDDARGKVNTGSTVRQCLSPHVLV